MADDDAAEQPHGTVLMAHGGWGHPDDWQWVRAPLDAAGVDVIAIDLPSHRGAEPGRLEDAATVRDALRGATEPVVGMGWSYGGDVVCEAVGLGAPFSHLVLLGSVPMPGERDDSWIDADPHITVHPDGRFELDGTWWVDEADGRTLPEPVRTELRRIGRRSSSRGTLGAVRSAAWLDVPATVVYGVDDPFVTPEQREWAAGRFDVRAVAGDHFVLFRTPQVVSDIVLEVLRGLDR